MLQVFLDKVAEGKDELIRNAAKGGVLVQSGIPLQEDDAKALQEQLNQWFPDDARI